MWCMGCDKGRVIDVWRRINISLKFIKFSNNQEVNNET